MTTVAKNEKQTTGAKLVDIARIEGVHVSTVSRALRGDMAISSETRRRVLRTARSLNYHEDPLVAALMRSRRLGRPTAHKANLGLIVAQPKSKAWWLFDVFNGARQEALTRGYSLDIFWLGDLHQDQRTFLRMLRARNIQGLLLPPEHEAMLPFELPWDEFAVVSLHYGRSQATPRFLQVVSNHFRSIIEVCEACTQRGYRRIGLILRDHPEIHYEYGRLVLGAFLAAADASRRPPEVPPLIIREPEIGSFLRWYEEGRPDVIIMAGCNWTPEFGVTHVKAGFGDAGYRIGRDVGLVIMGYHPTPEFAIFDERAETIGQVAAQALIDQLQLNRRGVPRDPLLIHVNGTFRPGRSLPFRRGSRANG